MPLSVGTRLGHYAIEGSLGAGGMGEVYKARDTRLNRDVAIKSLPDLFADDPERIARFEREAQVLASLNHPHIAGIHGVEQLDQARFLILEFIDGQSLADRLSSGPLPLDEALTVARQILDALEAAHDKGIIHRDIKPANIMLTADGQVKVLDFGLARVVESDPAKSAVNSPTLTFAATQVGIILGTAAYMAPEQAKGRVADKRSDVWAFGCVFYEMLAGKRVFDGEDVSETLAAVLRADPDWSALPPSAPAGVRALLKRCLERDRKARIPDISAVRFLLQDALATPEPLAAPVPSIAPARPWWRRVMPAALTGLVVAGISAAAVWQLRPYPAAPVTRFRFTLPEDRRFVNPGRRLIGVSPDGTRLVYVAGLRLHLRSIAEFDSSPIPGSDSPAGIIDPVFSPDGQSVAFFSQGDRTIKRVSVMGGTASTLCSAEPTLGISWSDSGVLFGQGRAGVMRVSPNGGKPETIISVEGDEQAYAPQTLPGGDRILFGLTKGIGPERWDNARVVVQSLSSGHRMIVVERGGDARYLPSGHVVYALGGTLFAVGFDARALRVTSGPMPVVEGVRRSPSVATGTAHYDVSRTGTLAYVPGPVSGSSAVRDLGFADRKGAVELLKLPPGPYQAPRISPDGKWIAVGSDDGKEAIIYVRDVAGTSALRRLTYGGNNRFPAWSADSLRVTFQSDRAGAAAVFWQRADGTGPAEQLTTPAAGESHAPESWSPKGHRLLFSVNKGPTVSLWVYSLTEKKAVPFGGVQSNYPTGAVFSPTGDWVAYTSNEQGRTTVYVQPDPPTDAKYQLYSRPGDSPHEVTWSPDGKELFYNPRPAALEAVSFTTAPTVAFGNPINVPKAFTLGPASAWRNYDVARDGRFLGVFTPDQAGGVAPTTEEIDVVINWFEELKARVK
jgi:serine/threonine-protein kinase